MSLLLHELNGLLWRLKYAYPRPQATLDLDFLNNRGVVAGVVGTALDKVTFTRNTTGTYFDSAGVMQTAAINAPRLDCDPLTGSPKGFLIEPQRTNNIRNCTMQGTVAGTPGTAPTNWGISVTATGLTSSVVGSGTEGGIAYVDITLAGTSTSTGALTIFFEGANVISASVGQTWALSAFWKLQAGSLTGFSTPLLRFYEYNASIGFLTSPFSVISAPTTAALRTQRALANLSVVSATAAYIRPLITLSILNNTTINTTLRIGMPQCELGSGATSVIATSSTALTRGADIAAMTGTNFSDWYSQTGGTFIAQVSQGVPSAASSPTIQLDDGTGNELILLGSASSAARLYVVDGGAAQAVILAGTVFANTRQCLAARCGLDDAAVTTAGAGPAFDNTLTLPTPNQLRFGSDGTNYLNGYLQRLTYIPRCISTPELIGVTR